MTRAEAAQMFYNLLLEKDVKITVEFEDVPADAWYAKPVNTLAVPGHSQRRGERPVRPGALYHPGGVHRHRYEVRQHQRRRSEYLLRCE